MSVEKFDKNLKVETSIAKEDIIFFDIEHAPFQIYGVFREGEVFRRMPEAAAAKVSEAVLELSTHGAGGRVRFITDSPYIAIKVEYGYVYRASHIALMGSSGFDLYIDKGDGEVYERSFIPPYDVKDGYESIWEFDDIRYDNKARHERIININFPLYSSVKKLYIGLKNDSVLKEAPGYRIEKPVVYYGSSITQGGCASKPGSSYQSILSRRFHCDYINLGFSGSAKGEETMADYISSLDMSAFVMDYDHNTPSTEHLAATHQRFFEMIRAAHPTLPIVILPAPRFAPHTYFEERAAIVKNTYLTAKAAGDKNVYFIGADKLMSLVDNNGTVDGCHPTDSGFLSMATAIGEVFEEIFGCSDQ